MHSSISKNISYVNHTSSSKPTGIVLSTAAPQSMMNIIKNEIFVYKSNSLVENCLVAKEV